MPAKTEKDPAIIEYAKTLANTPWCDDYEKMISGVLYDHIYPQDRCFISGDIADSMRSDTMRWRPS